MSDKATKLSIHQSLVQPVLVAGAEREIAILLGVLSLMIWIAGKDVLSIVIAILVWGVGIFLARIGAKKDPQFIKVFLKHIKYQDFYPATEYIHSKKE